MRKDVIGEMGAVKDQFKSYFKVKTVIWNSIVAVPVCCLSPVNGNMRYALPIMFVMPFVAGIMTMRAEDCS